MLFAFSGSSSSKKQDKDREKTSAKAKQSTMTDYFTGGHQRYSISTHHNDVEVGVYSL